MGCSNESEIEARFYMEKLSAILPPELILAWNSKEGEDGEVGKVGDEMAILKAATDYIKLLEKIIQLESEDLTNL